MKNRLKYFAIYAVGFVLFEVVILYSFDLGVTGNWHRSMCLGLAYFIANMAGDIERLARCEDRA